MRALRSDVLEPAARVWLARLAGTARSEGFYLAGGTAIALYCGCRPGRDLDFMGLVARLRSAERRDLLHLLLEQDPGVRVVTARDGFFHARTAEGVALRWYWYPYPLLEPEEEVEGCPVASRLDLGLMKLAAWISRGTRRDLADLYLLCRELPLSELLARSPEKFGHVVDFPLQAAKALADLAPDPDEEEPELGCGLTWETVEGWARLEVREFARRELGIE